MTLDPMIVLGAIWSVALLGIGALINHLVEKRPRLLAYYGHVAAFQVTNPDGTGESLGINTHGVFVRNAGRLTLHNVRVPHWGLLAGNVPPIHVTVFPPISTTREVVDGRESIVIPTLAPKQEVLLSYLYFPPIFASQINMAISSDEVMAKAT